MLIRKQIVLLGILALGCQGFSEQTNLANHQSGHPKSKLGIHSGFCRNVVESACSDQIVWDYVTRAKPAVLKILDAVDVAKKVKQLSPSTKIVGRLYLDKAFQDSGAQQPVNLALESWKKKVSSSIIGNTAVDYWEGYNEPNVGSIQAMQWYASFEKTRVEWLAKLGKKACIGNFSVGTPHIHVEKSEFEAWSAFLPALRAANQHQGVLCLHEYSRTKEFKDSYYWFVGRYRQVRTFLQQNNLGQLPIVITEFGFDVAGNPETDGWLAQGFTKDSYLQQLRWYDELMLQDSYVLGATIYSHGIPGWKSFDISSLLPLLGK